MAFTADVEDWLYRWQTLAGALIGAASGLLIALVVAHSARRREEVSSCILILRDLTEFIVMKDAYDKLWQTADLGKEKHPAWLLDRLLHRWPVLSPLFEPSAVRIMPANIQLAAHLSLFQKLHAEIAITLDEVKTMLQLPRTVHADIEINKRAHRIVWILERVIQHADCASSLINRLVLPKTYLFRRAARLVWKTAADRRCSKVLSGKSDETTR